MVEISRSASMVLMYLMRGERMPLREAWQTANKARHIIQPNPKLALALCRLDKELYGEHSI